MTAYDLDTDANGYYLEQLTLTSFDHHVTPLREGVNQTVLYHSVPSTGGPGTHGGRFTGTAIEVAEPDTAGGLSSPTDLTDEQASKGVQFFFRPQNGYIEARYDVSYSGPGASRTGINLAMAAQARLPMGTVKLPSQTLAGVAP